MANKKKNINRSQRILLQNIAKARRSGFIPDGGSEEQQASSLERKGLIKIVENAQGEPIFIATKAGSEWLTENQPQ